MSDRVFFRLSVWYLAADLKTSKFSPKADDNFILNCQNRLPRINANIDGSAKAIVMIHWKDSGPHRRD